MRAATPRPSVREATRSADRACGVATTFIERTVYFAGTSLTLDVGDRRPRDVNGSGQYFPGAQSSVGDPGRFEGDVVEQPVTRDAGATEKRIVSAAVGEPAAGLFDDQRQSGEVPPTPPRC